MSCRCSQILTTGSSNVAALRPDSTGHSLTLKVLDVKLVVDRRPAKGGSGGAMRIAEAIVGDETGAVVMTVKNEQVDLVQKGAYIRAEGARVDMHRGSMRLVVDRGGSLEAAQGESFKPKADFNMSMIEYELVSVSAAQAERTQPEANGTTHDAAADAVSSTA